MSKIFIISGTHEEFRRWRQDYVNTIGDSFILSQQDLVYVSGPEILKGITKPEGRFIGTWWTRNDIGEIGFQLLVAGSIESDKLDHILATRDKLRGVEMDLSLYGI